MSFEESPEVRQSNELEALQAIYAGDLRDLRGKPVWNQWVPLNLSLTLTPQQGSLGTQEFFVKVDLHIICDDKYPNSIPKLLLEDTKGLSLAVLNELQESLEQRAKGLVGEEMIFQLCQYVQEFLHKHNKPTSKSFYDEMLKRQKEQQEKDELAQQIEQDRQRQFVLEEVQKRQEVLRLEAKKLKEVRHNSENADEELEANKRKINENVAESCEKSLCHHKGTSVTMFGCREIQRGKCIKHSNSNHVTFTGMDKESGELIILSEWIIEIKDKIDVSSMTKTINSIEQEMNYLTKLRHPNLIQYYGLKHYIDDNFVVINLLKEFIYGTNCFSLFISHNMKLDIEFLKYIAKEVLIALDYLHRNNVVHKEIKNTNVYLSDAGVVKLSNYGIHRRLSDLTYSSHINYSKKTDIFKYGVFLLSLIEGKLITEDFVEIPNTIHSELYDLLTRCLAKEECDRFTTSKLLNHSFFHKPIVHFSPKHEMIEVERNVSPEAIQNYLPILSNSAMNGQSRISNEFEFLQHLGKGAFGDVIKVRNKLDGGYYAIKRIQLNPKNKTLNKKIIREVKLLSRLNHENVVRYYNSWIETTTIKEEDISDISSELEKTPKVIRNTEFTLNDNIEALAPSLKNVSITYNSKSQPTFDNSSDESSDEDEAWGAIYQIDSESDDGIEFKGSSKSIQESTSVSSCAETSSAETTQEIVKQIDFMYIQMEFCEKSTLRTAIDNNLCQDVDRVWRLFREIIEGLAHIHQQGMIHRDLKPVNIFLDSEDHVKIGDFGLATMSIKTKQNESLFSKSVVDNEGEDTVDESKTGQVGTALYVAPEINSSSKVVYSQKVDIYSLGIIFFEMCYRPLDTSMERIKILTKLRLKEVEFPKDFTNKETEKQQYLIRWLLDHDIAKRPTSQELLQCDYVPPPVIEECELRELVRHTLSNPQLKGYKYLIASCFKQPVTSAQDVTYDKDLWVQNVGKASFLQDIVKQKCIKIFRQHGGQNISTPLLMPKSKFYEGVESYVKLMTHFGGIVSLPHDLRVPFARYVAWNGITLLRRYSIERVYREKKVFGFQPRELYECAFDIVTPTQGSLMSDAEILYIVHEIINEFEVLKDKHFLIRLNHTSLIKGILLHCGIKDEHQEIYRLLSDAKEGKIPKSQLQNHFISLGLSDYTINLLLNMFNSEFDVSKAVNQFQMIVKKKYGEASQLTRQALQELKIISHNAEAYGVKFDIVISPGLLYNVQQYSGMICQFVCELKKHKHNNMEVLAAGGRYDSMVNYYQTMMEQTNMATRGIKQYAVGISISIDKLVQALQKEHNKDCQKQKSSSVDVVICSIGESQMIKERFKILKSLWAAGIKSYFIEVTNGDLEEVQDQLYSEARHIIILKDNEQGTVRVKSWDKDRFQEKSYTINELLENLQRIFKSSDNYLESLPLSILRSESKTNNEHNIETNVDIIFVTTDKISSVAKKRYENQIRSQLDGLFKRLTGYVTVIGLLIDTNVIRTLSSFLEFETEYQYQKSVELVTERHQRHRKYLTDVCDEIYEQKSNRRNPTVVLYSLSDYFFKVII